MTMSVAVGSKSALKLRAVEAALQSLGIEATIVGVNVSSGVPDQPRGIPEMANGASARAANALEKIEEAVIGIGIENGLVSTDMYMTFSQSDFGAQYYSFDPPCVAVWSREHGGPFFALGTFLPIPRWMVEAVDRDNTELGVVVQNVAGGGEKDPHKWLSDGKLPREEILKHAIMCALLPVLGHDTKYRAP